MKPLSTIERFDLVVQQSHFNLSNLTFVSHFKQYNLTFICREFFKLLNNVYCSKPFCHFVVFQLCRTGDMNNDSGSEISFERQSSGRYSFKIPRPFATYNTTSADNVSFHNRSFKEDETHRLREDEMKSLNGTLAKFYFDEIDYKSHDDFSRLHEDVK